MTRTPRPRPLELCPIEQQGPRGYIRTLFFFALDGSTPQEEIVRILKDGLEATKASIPIVSAEVYLDEGSSQKGKFALRAGDFGYLHVKTLSKTEFPLSFAELKKRNFPQSELHGDDLCSRPVFPAPGTSFPVFEAQANFIEGGVVLGLCVYHMVGDAFSIYKTMELWAYHCKLLQGIDVPEAEAVTFSDLAFDKEPLMYSSGDTNGKGKLEDHPEYILAPEPPPGPPESILNTHFRTQNYHLTPAALAQLKADASPVSATNGAHTNGEKPWISTNDAITGLIWRSVLAAQVPPEKQDEDPASLCLICVNVRTRSNPPLADDFIGAPNIYATPSIGIKTMLTSSLSAAALEVRKAVTSTDAEYLDSLITFLNSVPDYGCLAPAPFLDLMGNNLMISSWANFPIYGVNWGGVLGGYCERVRTPYTGLFNGAMVIMPALPERMGGGLEVCMGLHEENLGKLAEDEVWRRYATLC